MSRLNFYWKLFHVRIFFFLFLANLELNLYVKVCDDEDMKIPVKTSYTIEEIKTQIESLKEIPAKDQILTLNGIDLESDVKLTKDQIENSVIWLSYRSKEINLHIFENWRTKKETFKLEIDWDETISAIKTKIDVKKKIPPSWMQIYLGNGVWNDEAKLQPNVSLRDNDVFKKALKYGMSVMISGKINILDYDVNKVFSTEVEAFETITEIKNKVKDSWKESTTRSRYDEYDVIDVIYPRTKKSKFFETFITDPAIYIKDEFGMLKMLEDSDKPLYDYGLKVFFKENTLFMTRNPQSYPNQSYPIIVSTAIPTNNESTRLLKYFFHHNTTVGEVKAETMSNSPALGEKRLTTWGQMYSTKYKVELNDNNKTLKEYGIGSGSRLKIEMNSNDDDNDDDEEFNCDDTDENDTSSSDSDDSEEENEDDLEFLTIHELVMTDCKLQPCEGLNHSFVKDGIPKQEKYGGKVDEEKEVHDDEKNVPKDDIETDIKSAAKETNAGGP